MVCGTSDTLTCCLIYSNVIKNSYLQLKTYERLLVSKFTIFIMTSQNFLEFFFGFKSNYMLHIIFFVPNKDTMLHKILKIQLPLPL